MVACRGNSVAGAALCSGWRCIAEIQGRNRGQVLEYEIMGTVGLLKKSQIDSFRIQNERKQRSYRHVLPENVYCWGFSTGPQSSIS
jgi:hypothetical protein